MDTDFVKIFPKECDNAISTKNIEKIDSLIEKLKKLESRLERSPLLTQVWYCISNLYSTRAAIYNEDAKLWRNEKFPTNAVQSLNYIRRAFNEYIQNGNCNMCFEIQTNLANLYHGFWRDIEANYFWTFNYDNVIYSDSIFVAPFNKAKTLMELKDYLNDKKEAGYYAYEAYKLIKSLTENKNNIFHEGIKFEISNSVWVSDLLNWGKNIEETAMSFEEMAKRIKYKTKEEKLYRTWCAENNLFLNPLNDITKELISAQDTLEFPNYIVKIGEGPFLSVAFSDIKNRFCKARYIAYCGLFKQYPEWLEEGLFLTSCLDYNDFSTNTEMVKTAYKLCFGILDSIILLLKKYFEIESKSKTEFKPTWIQTNFQNIHNPFIDGLFWLSCDLTDISNIKNWQIPNPDADILRKLRNNLEHNWVRVADCENSIWLGDHDYAFVLSKEQLETATLEVFRYTRTAIMYLILAITYNEKQKIKNLQDEIIPSMEVPYYS